MKARRRGEGSMRRKERGGKKGKRGGGGTRGTQVCGKRGKAREGHAETSREVACSEDVRLEVLHILQHAVICRQTRTKRLAARHSAAWLSGLHASDARRRLTMYTLERRLARSPRESLPPGCQIRLLLRRQRRHHPRAVQGLLLRHLHLHPQGNLVAQEWRGR